MNIKKLFLYFIIFSHYAYLNSLPIIEKNKNDTGKEIILSDPTTFVNKKLSADNFNKTKSLLTSSYKKTKDAIDRKTPSVEYFKQTYQDDYSQAGSSTEKDIADFFTKINLLISRLDQEIEQNKTNQTPTPQPTPIVTPPTPTPQPVPVTPTPQPVPVTPTPVQPIVTPSAPIVTPPIVTPVKPFTPIIPPTPQPVPVTPVNPTPIVNPPAPQPIIQPVQPITPIQPKPVPAPSPKPVKPINQNPNAFKIKTTEKIVEAMTIDQNDWFIKVLKKYNSFLNKVIPGFSINRVFKNKKEVENLINKLKEYEKKATGAEKTSCQDLISICLSYKNNL